jgi:predicted RNA-binding protein
MCLSTVYVESAGQRKEIMQDVAGLEADNGGYLLTDLFGVRKFVPGRIKSVDLVSEHTIVLEERPQK